MPFFNFWINIPLRIDFSFAKTFALMHHYILLFVFSQFLFNRSDLDHLDNSSSFAGFTSRYAESFHVTLEFMVSPTERPRQSDNLVYPWETLPSNDLLSPKLCVSNHDELKNILSDYGK